MIKINYSESLIIFAFLILLNLLLYYLLIIKNDFPIIKIQYTL